MWNFVASEREIHATDHGLLDFGAGKAFGRPSKLIEVEQVRIEIALASISAARIALWPAVPR